MTTCLLLLSMSLLPTTCSAEDVMLTDDSALVPMSEYSPMKFPPGSGIYYPENFRILDCWKCFEAKGKMCIEEK